MRAHRIHAARRGLAQSGCAGIAIRANDPDFVAGNLCRIGKIEESTRSKGGVDEIASGATKDFFTEYHAEADTDGNLPERDGRRQGQREEDGGYEEAFAHFVLAHDTEQDFPGNPDRKSDDVDWQMQLRAKPKVGNQAGISNALRFRRLHANEVPAANIAGKTAIQTRIITVSGR